MLRIHLKQSQDQVLLRLEGRLVGDWVAELERCCRELLSHEGILEIVIDLDAVSYIDSDGEALLAALHACGVRLTARAPLCRFLVNRIQQRAHVRLASSATTLQD
jgi:anti-anti-sigma factor